MGVTIFNARHQLPILDITPSLGQIFKLLLVSVRIYFLQQFPFFRLTGALDEANGGSPIPETGGRMFDQLLGPKQRHQIKHRELFLSRQVETLPATHIRGKCSVTLFNETEAMGSYLDKDDVFFYCLVFDPTQKTLLADKGEIRVGSR